MTSITREVVLYAAASAVAFGVDVAALVALVELAGWPYLPAAMVAFTIGGLVAYAICVRYIFAYRRLADRRVEASSFVALGVGGLLVNAAGIYAGVELLALHYLVAKFLAAGLSFIVNYALRRLALFTRFDQEQG